MREVTIIGVGIHRFGRFPDKPPIEIGLEAIRMALKDANISWPEIEAMYCAQTMCPYSTGATMMEMLGRRGFAVPDIEAGCAAGGVAIQQAVLGMQAGGFDTCLVVGVDKAPRGFFDPSKTYQEWQIEMGMATNPSYWSMSARRHMEDYGTTELHLAKIAYKNHKNSVHNPYAMYQKEFTIEEILGSPIVCYPIHLYEICAPDDGAAALVLCLKDKADKYTSKPVTIAASVATSALYSADFRAPITQMSAKVFNTNPTEMAGKKAYKEAGIGPEDIDVAEVQDSDAFMELTHYEELGFCKVGEGGRLVDEGETEIGSRIPVNASGGLICKGEPVGASHLGQVVDLVWQLRGVNGPRQVEGAKVALANVTGIHGASAVTLLKR